MIHAADREAFLREWAADADDDVTLRVIGKKRTVLAEKVVPSRRVGRAFFIEDSISYTAPKRCAVTDVTASIHRHGRTHSASLTTRSKMPLVLEAGDTLDVEIRNPVLTADYTGRDP